MRKLVLGIGNTLNRDEGLGVHALDCVRAELTDCADVELVDGGTLGLQLLPVVEECSHLLVIDAIDADKDPGTIVELRGDDIRTFVGMKMSRHETVFRDVLAYATMRGRLPAHLVLIGVQPGDTSLGIGMSASVEKAMPALAARVADTVRRWSDPDWVRNP